MIDSLLALNGHSVLRLPPYSPELNPIELVWADIKQWVGSHNTTFKLQDMKELCQQRVASISAEQWEKVCDHVKKIEDQYIEQEGIMENIIESFVITNAGDSDTSETDDDNENDSDDMSGIESLSD